MRELIKVMKALSDESRVKIVKMLQSKPSCVCELTAALGLAQPTVSKHLKILEESGLAHGKKQGLWVEYRLTDGENSPFAKIMLGLLQTWLNDERQIKDLVAKLAKLDRNVICKR